MALVLKCNNCGGDIEVPDDVVKEALETGRPLIVTHDICPAERPKVLRYFKVVIQVMELPASKDSGASELLASFSSEASAASFTEAMPKVIDGLNEQWNRVAEMSRVIDENPPFAPTD